tara:strand:+ start:1056 stop:1346 length:291 start_codon:yes stop_codon:yes gene_type:complete
MSLQKKANIIKVRKKLDLLDNKLLDLIKKRTILVKEILKNKSSKGQIVDKKRIRVVLRNVKKKSLRKNIDSKLTQMIWKGMIKSYIDFEYRKFKKK